MIRDAEFWMEVRRKEGGGDPLFKTFLAMLHRRQATLAVHSTMIEVEEEYLMQLGEEKRDLAYGRVIPDAEKIRKDQKQEENKIRIHHYFDSANGNNTLRLPDTPHRHVSSSTIRVLQRVMLFAVPIYSLRYKVFAMALGKNTSCFVDRVDKKLMTFGSTDGVNITEHIKCRGCVVGDQFFSVVTDNDQVWASGDLTINTLSKTVSPLGKKTKMYGLAAKALMLVATGDRLAYVSRDFKVHLLSSCKQHGHPLLPSRHVRFLALGRPSDVYMVGTDSILYKVTRSDDAMNTPRRMLAFARIPVSRVAAGVGFIIVIDQCGRLLTFGRNKYGQLGNGGRQDYHRRIFHIRTLHHHFFVQAAAGEVHSLVLTSSGLAYGSGSNSEGQLGLGGKIREVSTFTHIRLPCKCLGIAAGPFSSAFALEDGSVYVCGVNHGGRLGVVDDELDSQALDNLYWPTRVPSIVDGIESYTLDFSGRAPLSRLVSAQHATEQNGPQHDDEEEEEEDEEDEEDDEDEEEIDDSRSGSSILDGHSDRREADPRREPDWVQGSSPGQGSTKPKKTEKASCGCC